MQPDTNQSSERTSRESMVWVRSALVGMIMAWWLGRLPLLVVRRFDPDEFEHLHAAWCISQGQMLYVDFFEHHTPWYYWFLLPWFGLLDPAGSPDDAVKVMFLARLLSWVLAGIALGLVVWIGARWAGIDAGLLGALLLAGMPMVVEKTLEARPDMLALPLWLLGAGWLAVRLRSPNDLSAVRPWPFLGAGMCVGAAILCTQKMLFTLPGVAVALVLWLAVFRRDDGARTRLWSAVSFVIGLVIPLGLTWAWFAWRGAGGAFVEMNFVLNARWQVRIPPDRYLAQLWDQSWLVCLMAVGGLAVTWARVWRERRWDGPGVLMTTSLLGLLAGLYVIPVAMRQYYLMLLPLLTLFAARALVECCRQLPGRWRAVWLIVVLALAHITPVNEYLGSFRSRNDAQLATLRFVQTRSAPDDSVLDGWRGKGVFRPHAFYYYFLHHEVRAMIPEADWEAFLAALESGEIRPMVIVMDGNLRDLEGRMSGWLEEHYEWVREHRVYLRRQGESDRSSAADAHEEEPDFHSARSHERGYPRTMAADVSPRTADRLVDFHSARSYERGYGVGEAG